MTGQMSLFDLVEEEDKQAFEIQLPDVGEYSKEMKLGFEKEVLGVYISGHPLEEYEEKWRKNITQVTTDFLPDEESGAAKVRDGAKAIIGGMITGKTVKPTRTNTMMAFIQIEDLVGTVEVIIFPRDYEKYSSILIEDSKVFVLGRISAEEEKASKLICEKIIPFDTIPRELWVKFPDLDAFRAGEQDLYDTLRDSDGQDRVVVYVENPKAVKRLPPARNIRINPEILSSLTTKYGENNIKVVEMSIENKKEIL